MESWQDIARKDSCAGRRDLVSKSCPLTSTCKLVLHMLLHVNVCMHEYTCSKRIFLKSFMTWQLRALVALVEDPSSTPSAHMVVHSRC